MFLALVGVFTNKIGFLVLTVYPKAAEHRLVTNIIVLLVITPTKAEIIASQRLHTHRQKGDKLAL